jgi:PAS domain S-box-containing protein
MKQSSHRLVTFNRAILIFAVVISLHLAVGALLSGDKRVHTIFNDVASPIEGFLAAAALFLGARRSAVVTSRRLFIAWGLLALSQVAWGVGDVVWLVLEVSLKQPPFPSVASLGYLAYYALFTWGIVSFPTRRLTRDEWVRLLLDAGIAALAVLLVFWYFLIGPFLQTGGSDLTLLFLLFSSSILDLFALMILFLLFSRRFATQSRGPLWLLAASISIRMVANSAFGYQFNEGTYVGGGLADIGWAVSALVAGLAGALQADTVGKSAGAAHGHGAERLTGLSVASWIVYSPYVWLGVAYLMLVSGYGRDLTMEYPALIIWVGTIIGLVVIRQVVASADDRRLLAEHRRADEALRESEEKYRVVVENADEGIVVAQDGRFTYVNPAACKIIGCSPDEIVGKPFLDVIHPDDRAQRTSEYDRKLSGDERTYPSTYRVIAKDGSSRWITGSGTLINWEGRPAVLGYVRDITDEKKTEEIEQARAERVIRDQKTLLELGRLDTSDLDVAFRKISEVGGATLEVERVGIWLFEAGRSELVLKDLFKRSDGSHEAGDRLLSVNYPGYFTMLDESRIIAAADAVTDERTGEFARGYLIPLGITSMMDVPIRLRGVMVGVLCHEHIGAPRQWTIEDQEFAASVADTISLALEASERRKAEEALHESEERYRYLFENSLDAVFTTDLTGNFTSANRTVEEVSGYTKDELIGKSYRDFVSPEASRYIFEMYNRLFNTGQPLISVKYAMMTKGGEERTVEGYATLLRKGDEVVGFQGTLRDITDRLRLEEQLAQMQKMEAVGAMAGGIAHNFNNIMVGIMGYSEFLLGKKSPDDPDYKALRIIHEGTLRASELTKQLLSISRGAQYDLIGVDLNRVINKVMPLIIGTFDKTIAVKTHLAPDLSKIEGDVGRLEQCLLNLCINARDAMPRGGTLTIETKDRFLDKEFVRSHLGAKSGPYVVLTITDTGTGIAPDIKDRIFEPFFTTKRDSGGTGMGLATVYGIMRSHNGFVTVYSESDCGSTFNLYFPAATGRPEPVAVDEKTGDRSGGETILLIDDEPVVREMWGDFFAQKGYRVLVAENGLVGLDVFTAHRDEIDLVILDLIMPKLGGKDTLAGLREINPTVKVLVTSGYSENGQAGEIVRLGVDGFVQKPAQLALLEEKVEEILKK